MYKAIDQGNGRKVDGWFIKVKKATYGWGDRKRLGQEWQKKLPKSSLATKRPAALKDNHSYREVLMGDREKATSKASSHTKKGTTADNMINTAPEEPTNKPKKVEYDLDIPKQKWNGST